MCAGVCVRVYMHRPHSGGLNTILKQNSHILSGPGYFEGLRQGHNSSCVLLQPLQQNCKVVCLCVYASGVFSYDWC